MLLAGEVESVTVFPSINVAAINLRPGAIFKVLHIANNFHKFKAINDHVNKVCREVNFL
jgi:hypothetical protein